MTHPTRHVVLLGDSVFDNAAYTSGAPDVITHLRGILPPAWQATLLAMDGATTAGLSDQLAKVPVTASHLVISVGGNDALQHFDLLSLRVASSSQALAACAGRIAPFEAAYRLALMQATRVRRPMTVCTIYNGALDEPEAEPARMAVALFDDAILRTAAELRVDVLELRSVCTERGDYANPIEPSGRGGRKIATAIAKAIGAVTAANPPTRVWTLR